MSFGANLRKIIEEKNLSQVQAAELLGIKPPSFLYYLKSSKTPNPGMQLQMSAVFGVSEAELRGESAPGKVVRETPAASQISDLQSQIAALRAENRVLKKRLAVISKAANP